MVRVGSMDGLQVWRAYTASGQDRADPLRYMSSSYRRGFRHRLIRYYNRPPTVPGNRNPGCLWGAIAQHRDHLLAGPTSTTVTPSNSAARARSTPRTRPVPGPGATRAGRTLVEPLPTELNTRCGTPAASAGGRRTRQGLGLLDVTLRARRARTCARTGELGLERTTWRHEPPCSMPPSAA